MILVVGSHSSRDLQNGSLRDVNIPFATVGAPAAKNFDEPRRQQLLWLPQYPNTEAVSVTIVRLEAALVK